MSTNNSILKDVRQALINAHNSNNGKAITKDFAAGSGVSEKAYTSWVTWINTLHYKVTPWAEKWNNGKVEDAEIQAIYDDIMPILKQLNRVDDKLFIRTNDVAAICKMVHEFGKSENGSVDVVKGQVAFRRQIETMLGNRLAQNDALSEDDYDIVVKYDRAVVNKAKAEDRLNGYVDKKGQKVEGLKDQLKDAKDTLENVKKALLAMDKKLDEKALENNPIVAGYIKTVEDLEGTIKSVEGNIAKCKDTIKKHGKKYKELMANINKA